VVKEELSAVASNPAAGDLDGSGDGTAPHGQSDDAANDEVPVAAPDATTENAFFETIGESKAAVLAADATAAGAPQPVGPIIPFIPV
jgi:hypothetical protein